MDDAKKVLIGKNGYLFLDNDTNNVIEQISGVAKIGSLFGYRYKVLIENRYLYLQNKGIDYYYMIAPNKECVYSELLPETIILSPQRTIGKMMTELEKSSFQHFFYPFTELIAAKKINIVYSYGDTHWTQFGAFVGYKILMNGIVKKHKVRVLNDDEVVFNVENKQGDLISKIHKTKKDKVLNATILNARSRLTYTNKIVGTGNYEEYINDDKALPVALMFRDSFANAMLPFLAESFSRLIVVHQPNIDFTLVDTIKPDLVISLQVERFLLKIPNDILGMTNQQYVRKKRNKGTTQL